MVMEKMSVYTFERKGKRGPPLEGNRVFQMLDRISVGNINYLLGPLLGLQRGTVYTNMNTQRDVLCMGRVFV